MWLFEQSVAEGVEDFLILSGDHLYRCNYQDFVREHRENGSDITVAALPCDPERASAFGLMKINDQGRITSFAEKPTGDALKAMEVDTTVLGLDADKAQVPNPASDCLRVRLYYVCACSRSLFTRVLFLWCACSGRMYMAFFNSVPLIPPWALDMHSSMGQLIGAADIKVLPQGDEAVPLHVSVQ